MPKEGHMQVKTAPVAVKAVDAETGVFEAIVSVFGNKDSYGDVVMPGAFTKTLEEWAAKGDPIPVYWSHRMDDPDYNIGHVIDAKEVEATETSPAGLWVKAQIDLEGGKAPQVHRLLKGRRVTQFSFAYDVISDKKNADVNELHELKLYEIGPTPIGANQSTELLAVKAAGEVAANLAAGLKAGRVISSKNESELRKAHEAIGNVLSAIGQDEDEQKASGDAEAKSDASAEGREVKASASDEEPKSRPSAKTFAQIQLLALSGQEGDSK